MTKLLPYLLTIVTQRARYKVVAGVDFQWSSTSITYNLFRVFELLFWRKQGIRVEMSSYKDLDGKEYHYFHSFESVIVNAEVSLRKMFTLPKMRFVKVYVPIFAGVPVPHTQTPYLFAIAFDSTNAGSTTSGATLSFNITCTGSNMVLTAGTQTDGPVVAQPLSVVFNTTETMTSAVSNTQTNFACATWYRVAPTTGSALAVLITYAGATQRHTGGAISLSGADSSQPGVTGSAQDTSATSSTISVSVTTTVANSMLIDSAYNNNAAGTQNPGGSQVKRMETDNPDGFTGLMSNLLTTTTGSYSMTWTLNQVASWATTTAEIKPFVASTVNSNFLIFM